MIRLRRSTEQSFVVELNFGTRMKWEQYNLQFSLPGVLVFLLCLKTPE